jgi:hypothetical protein
MQWEDDIFRKINIPFKKEKALQGESHERWGMKQDLKVLNLEKR